MWVFLFLYFFPKSRHWRTLQGKKQGLPAARSSFFTAVGPCHFFRMLARPAASATTSLLTLFPFGAIGIPRSSWAKRGSQFLIGFAIGFGSTMGFILSISCAFSTIHWDCRTDTYGTHGNSSQTTLLNTSFVRRQLGDCPCQTKASRGGYRHLD